MARIEIPTYADKNDLFGFLVENKELHYKQKQNTPKEADSVHYLYPRDTNKAASNSLADATTLEVKSVINTTNLMDSHSDVHIPKIWNKSLKETKNFLLLQEHKMDFRNVISDEVKAYVETMQFKELGFSRLKMETQALIFQSLIQKERNEYMFEQYQKGFVKNHSVGMRYMKMYLAVNSDSSEYKEEKEVYDKYIDQVANRKAAEDQGYFWPILEAKVLEGSAVVKGSNPATPTQSVESKEAEPSNDTHKTEPPAGTHNLHLY